MLADTNIDNICKTYFERPLSGFLNEYHINVVTDCMIAQPKLGGDPDKPYFFLQERNAARFKQAQHFGKTDGSGRPSTGSDVGSYAFSSQRRTVRSSTQTVINFMVVMSLKRTVAADHWHFTTLKGLEYCISRQYDFAQKADLLQIIFIPLRRTIS